MDLKQGADMAGLFLSILRRGQDKVVELVELGMPSSRLGTPESYGCFQPTSLVAHFRGSRLWPRNPGSACTRGDQEGAADAQPRPGFPQVWLVSEE